MACPPEAAKYSDDRKVWTDTAEVKNKASGPADRRWAIHPQGSALSILDFFQSVQKTGNQLKNSKNKEKMLENELLIIHGSHCCVFVLNFFL
ncbi:hypothetical protein FHS59_004649 [Algoriphagus iocasae]|uniref:Uncharacterized protein n=1 Tax=Algoriphagus iocasae TaxID=1836499 RepID=A0A841N2X1_9BACT|nr:hypothetical protein [Algoriphagus iocasae]